MLKCRFFKMICILSQIKYTHGKQQVSISPQNDELEIQITDSDNAHHFVIIEKPGRKFQKDFTSNKTYQYKDLTDAGIYPSDPIHFTIFGLNNSLKVHESSIFFVTVFDTLEWLVMLVTFFVGDISSDFGATRRNLSLKSPRCHRIIRIQHPSPTSMKPKIMWES